MSAVTTSRGAIFKEASMTPKKDEYLRGYADGYMESKVIMGCDALEALINLAREMRHMLHNNPKKDGGLYRQRLDEADAAIARAEGRS